LSVKVKSLGASLSNEEINRLKSLNLSKKTVILSGIDWYFTKARGSLTRVGESLLLKSDQNGLELRFDFRVSRVVNYQQEHFNSRINVTKERDNSSFMEKSENSSFKI
jgi:hypothetical protein